MSSEYIEFNIEDDDCIRSIKETLRALPLPDRTIYTIWLEEGTYSEVAKQLRCSVPTISKKVRAISERIKQKTEEICKDS